MIMSEERRKPNHARWENLMDNALIDLLVSFSDSDPYYRRDGEFSGTSWRHIIQELIKTFPESKEKFTRQKVLQHFRILLGYHKSWSEIRKKATTFTWNSDESYFVLDEESLDEFINGRGPDGAIVDGYSAKKRDWLRKLFMPGFFKYLNKIDKHLITLNDSTEFSEFSKTKNISTHDHSDNDNDEDFDSLNINADHDHENPSVLNQPSSSYATINQPLPFQASTSTLTISKTHRNSPITSRSTPTTITTAAQKRSRYRDEIKDLHALNRPNKKRVMSEALQKALEMKYLKYKAYGNTGQLLAEFLLNHQLTNSEFTIVSNKLKQDHFLINILDNDNMTKGSKLSFIKQYIIAGYNDHEDQFQSEQRNVKDCAQESTTPGPASLIKGDINIRNDQLSPLTSTSINIGVHNESESNSQVNSNTDRDEQDSEEDIQETIKLLEQEKLLRISTESSESSRSSPPTLTMDPNKPSSDITIVTQTQTTTENV